METYTRKVNYEYNAQGGLTKEIRDPDPDSPTVTTLYEQFDDFGNARKVTVSAAEVPSRVTQYQYDPKGRFATRVTNTLGQHTNYTYDGRWGQPLTVTDITGLTASSQYDAFGRLKQSTDPLGHTSTTTMAWDMGTFGTSVYRIETQSPGAPDGKVWMDAYNREVRSEAEGFDVAVVASKQYDPRGRTLWGAVPNPKTGGGQQVEQMFGYDNYNRIQSVSDGIRTTSSVFASAGSTYNATVIDPGGRQRTQKTDATGKVMESTDPGGSLNFSYHANGKVTKTMGSGPNPLTQMTYDDFGNQIALTDIDGGTTQYVYNAFGELISQTDALENTHTMQYDAMGRITQRSGPDGTVTYQYVTQGNGLNQVRKATFVSGGTTTKQEYTYDEFGRVLSKKETIQDDAVMVFTTSYTYDDLGRVATMTYPSGLVLSYDYDANGHLKKVKNGSTIIYELEGKNALGQVTEYSLGNGVTTTKTINEHGHLTEILAAGVQHLTMEFDPLTGNLNWRKNNLSNVQEDFAYDNLDRLFGAEVDGQTPLVVDYANNGNILEKTDAGEYDYHAEKIHAVRSITNQDLNISLVEQNITYTPWGRRTATINEDINNAVFTYGPDNERKKLAMQVDYTTVSTRYYSGNYEEYQAPNGDVYKLSYVSGGDGLCAIHVVKNSEQPQFYYVYKDHLGSILALTDDEGDIEGEQSFDAWGRYRDPATWEVLNSNPFDDELVVDMPDWFTRGYTGHEHMQKFDLINMNGRMYDPLQARMLAVDNYVQDPYSTQAYNRHSYVWNNPLSYTDPTGEYLIEYLTQAYNKNTWDPFGWGANGFSGGFTVGFSSMGEGSSFFAGGSLSSGSLYVVGGMNSSTGAMGGGISGNGGIPSYNEPMRAGTVNINMGSVHPRQYGIQDLREFVAMRGKSRELAYTERSRQANDPYEWLEACSTCGPKPKGSGRGNTLKTVGTLNDAYAIAYSATEGFVGSTVILANKLSKKSNLMNDVKLIKNVPAIGVIGFISDGLDIGLDAYNGDYGKVALKGGVLILKNTIRFSSPIGFGVITAIDLGVSAYDIYNDVQ